MNVALMVVTDGREYFWETMESFIDVFAGYEFAQRIIVDDSLNPTFQERVKSTYPEFALLSAETKKGFSGAIQAGWAAIDDDIDYVFHLEDDFVPTKLFYLDGMISILQENPHLVQMALLRGSVSQSEINVGGVIQQDPDSYSEQTSGFIAWREHRKFFTTNPSVYPRWIMERGWPEGADSEGRFGAELFNNLPEVKSAFWGSFESGTWVEHIGKQRAGTGY